MFPYKVRVLICVWQCVVVRVIVDGIVLDKGENVINKDIKQNWLCWKSLFTTIANVIRRHLHKMKVQLYAWISVM